MKFKVGETYVTRDRKTVTVKGKLDGFLQCSDERTRYSDGRFLKTEQSEFDIVGPALVGLGATQVTTRCLACGEEVSSSVMHVCSTPKGKTPVTDGYEELRWVLALAVRQASEGKGRERHAIVDDFIRQPIMEIGRMVGPGYHLGQAMKKAHEASRLPRDRAQAELLGAINYIAAAYLLLEERNAT